MVTILLVEDDLSIRMLTKEILGDKYNILEAGNGEEALDILDHNHVDLIIADIMMPKMDGYELVNLIRNSGDDTPVIMLTAMNTYAHKKKGFATGIDDYLTKPIDYDELMWRIEAILRRAKIANENSIQIGDLMISEKNRSAVWKGKNIELTEKEFELLYKLLLYPNIVITKQQIMDEIWGFDSDSAYDTIKTYINYLRNKFIDCDAFEIVTVRGLGYKVIIQEDI